MFNIGDRVVCINDDFSMHPLINQHYKQLPKKDKIYTVRSCDVKAKRVLLNELLNPIMNIGGFMAEGGFAVERFALTKEADSLLNFAEEILSKAVEKEKQLVK